MLAAVKTVWWVIGRWGRSMRASGGTARRVQRHMADGLANFVGDRMLQPGQRVEFRVRAKAGFKGAAEIGAGHAFKFVVELDRQISALDKRVQPAAGARQVGVNGAIASARAGAWQGFAAECYRRLRAVYKAVAIPGGTAAAETQAMHHAGAGKPVEALRVGGSDRVRTDPHKRRQATREYSHRPPVQGSSFPLQTVLTRPKERLLYCAPMFQLTC